MKRAILLIAIGAALGAGAVWMFTHAGRPTKLEADETGVAISAEGDATKVNITRDTNDNVVISMPDKLQVDLGIVVTNPAAARLSPELKLFGRVADPTPLGNSLMEFARATSAFDNSHRELERMKILQAQTNVSDRAFQAAEATYRQDQLAVSVIQTQIQAIWGKRVAELLGPVVVPVGEQRKPNPLLFQIMESEAVLVRLDLPVGEHLETDVGGARILRVGENATPVRAEFFDFAPVVDAQTQSRGTFFLVPENKSKLVAGEAVVGYVELSAGSSTGVIIPGDAIVRTEGKGWIYVRSANGQTFTRREVPLDHPTDSGWFATNGVSASDQIVVRGAQVLLSQELKAAMSAD